MCKVHDHWHSESRWRWNGPGECLYQRRRQAGGFTWHWAGHFPPHPCPPPARGEGEILFCFGEILSFEGQGGASLSMTEAVRV